MAKLGCVCAPAARLTPLRGLLVGSLLGLLLGLQTTGCDAGRDRPGVGTPGLEPPSERNDAGGPEPNTGGGGRGSSMGNPDGSGGQMGGPAVPPAIGGGGGSSAGTAGAGGGLPVSDADAGALDGPGDALFAGLWVVDQPSHALYEATLYELGTDGAIGELETMLDGAPPFPDYVTGTVQNADASVRCRFAGEWRSLEARLLELDAACDDGNPRAVRLAFPDGDDETIGILPTVISAGGEPGWDHRDWPWMWRKCGSRDDCPPF